MIMSKTNNKPTLLTHEYLLRFCNNSLTNGALLKLLIHPFYKSMLLWAINRLLSNNYHSRHFNIKTRIVHLIIRCINIHPCHFFPLLRNREKALPVLVFVKAELKIETSLFLYFVFAFLRHAYATDLVICDAVEAFLF